MFKFKIDFFYKKQKIHDSKLELQNLLKLSNFQCINHQQSNLLNLIINLQNHLNISIL
jgi:hypothetical protein